MREVPENTSSKPPPWNTGAGVLTQESMVIFRLGIAKNGACNSVFMCMQFRDFELC